MGRRNRVVWAFVGGLAIVLGAGIGILRLNRTIRENETDAVTHLKSIVKAERMYHLREGHFTPTLSELDISSGLKDGEESGYRFRVTGTPTGDSVDVLVIAEPIRPGRTGRRIFQMDGREHLTER